jgi:hypothetical protein
MWPSDYLIHSDMAQKIWQDKGWKMSSHNALSYRFDAKRLGDSLDQAFGPGLARSIHRLFRVKQNKVNIIFPEQKN